MSDGPKRDMRPIVADFWNQLEICVADGEGLLFGSSGAREQKESGHRK